MIQAKKSNRALSMMKTSNFKCLIVRVNDFSRILANKFGHAVFWQDSPFIHCLLTSSCSDLTVLLIKCLHVVKVFEQCLWFHFKKTAGVMLIFCENQSYSPSGPAYDHSQVGATSTGVAIPRESRHR